MLYLKGLTICEGRILPKKHQGIRKRPGFMLIDVMLGAILLAIMVIGTLSVRYHSTTGLQKAAFQVSASRTAELLCQSWKGVRGTESFKPIESFGTAVNIAEAAGFSESDSGWPQGFTLLKTFKIVIDSTPYYTALGYKDIQPGLRALTVIVAWAQRGPAAGKLEGGQRQAITFSETDKTYRLTTYVSTK